MSSSYLSLYDVEHPVLEGPFDTVPTRSSIIERAVSQPACDIVVIGGGLTGALVAHHAALVGLRVLVVSDGAIGERASCWEVRYRELCRDSAWALLSSLPAMIAFARSFDARHLFLWSGGGDSGIAGRISRFILAKRNGHRGELFGTTHAGVPMLNTSLCAREVALSARQEGALIISGARDLFLEAERDTGCYRLGFVDRVSGEAIEMRAGCVVLDPSLSHVPRTRIGTLVKPSLPPFSASTRTWRVIEESGIFCVAERGPWDAHHSAQRIVAHVLRAGGLAVKDPHHRPASRRRLPGAASPTEIDGFRAAARAAAVPEATVAAALARWAGRVRYVSRCEDGFTQLIPGVLRGEVEMAVRLDHAATVDEILFGSLACERGAVVPADVSAVADYAKTFGVTT